MKKQQKLIIGIGILMLVGFAVAGATYKQGAEETQKKAIEESPSALVRPTAKFIGPADAKVHIVEFMDPGCETCAMFHPLVHQIVEHYQGKVRASIRYLPLHEGSDTMVKILEAADKQDKYWTTLELMFRHQSEWASHHHPQPEKIWPLLPQAGLDVEAIRRDMNSPEIAAILEEDMKAAKALNLTKTPSFFVDEAPLMTFGAQPLANLVAQAVAKKYGGSAQ